jgi:hypothetical protein
MEGQSVYVDEMFESISGARGMTPGTMGRANEDINCRCYSSRRIAKLETQLPETMVKGTFDDWQKAKRSV